MKAADVLQQKTEVLEFLDFFAQGPKPVLDQPQKSRLDQAGGCATAEGNQSGRKEASWIALNLS